MLAVITNLRHLFLRSIQNLGAVVIPVGKCKDVAVITAAAVRERASERAINLCEPPLRPADGEYLILKDTDPEWDSARVSPVMLLFV